MSGQTAVDAAPRRDEPEGLGWPRKFLFDHIPKTGGTAFRAVLEKIFGAQNVSPWVSGRSENWAQGRFADYAVISGHFHSPIPMERSANDRARLTMLRNPIDRIVSEYYYYRNDVGRTERNKLAVLAKDHDLGSYLRVLRATRDMAVANLYSRRFASQVSRWHWSEDRVLELADRALERYDFVGIQEQFVDSVDLFCCQYRLPPVLDPPKINITSSRKRIEEIDRATRETLVDLNRLDIELYDRAVERFQQKKRRVFHHYASGSKTDAPLAHSPIPAKSGGSRSRTESFGTRVVEVIHSEIVGLKSETDVIHPGEQAELRLTLAAHAEVPDLTVGFEISDELGEIVFGTNTFLLKKPLRVLPERRYAIAFSFSANLKHGHYSIGVALHTGPTHEECCFHWSDSLCSFEITDSTAADFVGYCRLAPEVIWSGD